MRLTGNRRDGDTNATNGQSRNSARPSPASNTGQLHIPSADPAGVSHTSPPEGDPLAEGADAARGDKQTAAYLELIRSLSTDERRAERFIARLEGFEENYSDETVNEAIESVNQKVALYFERRAEINIHIEGRLEALASSQTSASVSVEGEVEQSDPLVFDLDGDGVELTRAANGSNFDINADGTRERTAFATGGDAFLALDRNQNGFIDNGSELFGDQNGAKDGFAELRKYDGNEDGMIDRQDAVFDQLRLFADGNRDGISQQSELKTLAQAGIESINLTDRIDPKLIQGGAQISTAAFTRTDGSQGTAADVLVNYLA